MKEASADILIPGEIDFKLKLTRKNKGYFLLIKGTTNQEEKQCYTCLH